MFYTLFEQIFISVSYLITVVGNVAQLLKDFHTLSYYKLVLSLKLRDRTGKFISLFKYSTTITNSHIIRSTALMQTKWHFIISFFILR
jgi:hypothetical protein